MFHLFDFSNDDDNQNFGSFSKQGRLLLRENGRVLQKNRANMALITQTSAPHLGYIDNVEGFIGENPSGDGENPSGDGENPSGDGENPPFFVEESLTLTNGRANSKLMLDSNYLQYAIWLLLSFFLILLAFYTFYSNDQSLIVQLTIGVVIVVVLYLLVGYVRTNLI